MTRVTLIGLIALVLLTATSSADREQLKRDYPSQQIFVTWSALWDMYDCTSQKLFIAAETTSTVERKEAVKLLTEFLKARVANKKKMNEAPAFLLLDFGRSQAGFKMTFDATGFVNTDDMPEKEKWKKRIVETADLVSQLLRGQDKMDAPTRGTSIDVAAVWAILKGAKTDPYVSRARYQTLGARLAIVANSTEGKVQLAKLKPELASEIRAFAKALPVTDLKKFEGFFKRPLRDPRELPAKSQSWDRTFEQKVPAIHR